MDARSEGHETAVVSIVVIACVLAILGMVAVGIGTRSTHDTRAATVALTSSNSASLEVHLNEFSVAMPATTLTPGIKTLRVSNTGTVPHELLVFRSDLPPSAYPLDHGDINEDGPGVTKISDGDNIDPGKDQARTVDLSTPGTYLFVCNLPGHFGRGMFTVVTVGATPEAIPVALSEFNVGVGATTVPRGTATLSITNKGAVQHELLVFRADVPPSRFPLDPDGTIQEDAPGMNKISDGDNIDPGKGQTRTIELTAPGTYVLVCNLPGHFRSGMYTTITVP